MKVHLATAVPAAALAAVAVFAPAPAAPALHTGSGLQTPAVTSLAINRFDAVSKHHMGNGHKAISKH